MELIRLFLSASWQNIALAVLTGLLGGASSAGIIALINSRKAVDWIVRT